MKVEALGPLLVDGQRMRPRERTLVAALAVRRGRFVGVGELAEALWGVELPPTWRKQVQIAVGRVRKLLGAERVETAGSGYALRLADGELDASHFETLVEQARKHASRGEHPRAVVVLEQAIALWRGEPYDDVAGWPPGVDEAVRLVEVRRGAEEELLRARLDGGWHRSVVADAEALVRADPAREDRWAMLATALYRSGRQRDALAALREARGRLRDELGLDPGRGLTDLEAAILTQDGALEPTAEPVGSHSECPYRGLGAFDLADAQEFFGREEDAAAAVDTLLATRLLVLTGPSGCGKSSLARAGVAPTLRALGASTTILTPGAGGVAALQTVTERTPRGVVVVDQLEELFQEGVSPLDREEYARVITAFTLAGGSAVITVRSDRLDRCVELPGLGPALSDAVRFVRPMTEAGLRAAIEEPARLAGLQVESGLTELVLRDVVGRPAALPHLSHALVETWARREGSLLTVAGYQATGGIAGAIGQSAETCYQGLDPVRRDLCRSVLVRLVGLDGTGAPVRRRTPLGPLRADPMLDDVVSRLASARLVTIERQWVLVAHESLVTAWPRLLGWLEEDTAGAKILPALATAADDWAAEGEAESDLYRGDRLRTALDWTGRSHPELTTTERRFLDASASRERDEVAALAALAQTERRRNRRLRVLLGTVLTLLLVAAAAGATALSAQRRSARESERAAAARSDAEFAGLVATSVALRSSQRDVASLLAAEAYRRRPDDPRARNAVMSTLVAAGGFLGTEYVPGAAHVSGAAAPDGTVVLATDKGTVSLYRNGPLREVRRFEVGDPDGARTGDLPSVIVSASGRRGVVALALAAGGIWVRGFDLAAGRAAGPAIQLPVDPVGVAVDRSGTQVAVVGEQGDLVTTSLAGGPVTRLVDTDVVDAAFAGRRLVVTREDGSVVLAGRDRGAVSPASVGARLAVVGHVALTSGDLGVAAVDLTTGQTRWDRPYDRRQQGSCEFLAVHAGTGAVYCGDQFGRIQRRDLATGEVVEELDRQLGAVGELSVSRDGATLTAVGGGVPAVSRWRLDGGGPVTRVVARGQVASGYNGDTGELLTAARPRDVVDWLDYRRFVVWDTATDRPVSATLRGEAFGWVAPGILQGIFSDTHRVEYVEVPSGRRYVGDDPLPLGSDLARSGPSGHHVYVSQPDGTVQDLDPATGADSGAPLAVPGYILDMAPDPDERHLAATYYRDGGLHLTVLDTATGEALGEAPTSVVTVAYAPDGSLYGATDTGRISRFDLVTLRPDRTWAGARGWINSLQFSGDGSLLLATANDSTVALYDVASGQRLGDPIVSEAPGIWAGFLEPDGRELVANIPAGIAVWDLDPQAQLAAACAIAGRQLTRAEWTTYLAGFGSYRQTCPG